MELFGLFSYDDGDCCASVHLVCYSADKEYLEKYKTILSDGYSFLHYYVEPIKELSEANFKEHEIWVEEQKIREKESEIHEEKLKEEVKQIYDSIDERLKKYNWFIHNDGVYVENDETFLKFGDFQKVFGKDENKEHRFPYLLIEYHESKNKIGE